MQQFDHNQAASRAVQQIQSAHAEWRRRNGLDGNGDGMAVMAGDGGNLLKPLDAEEWGRTTALWIAQIGSMTEAQIKLVCQQCMERCAVG
jgi:hypothetical protein